MKSIGTLVKHPISFILIVLILIFILLLSSKASVAATMPPIKQIIEVVDGNTLKVVTVDDDTFLVKLKGVDAPEQGQEFGNEATAYLQKLVSGKNVLVEYSGKDRWGNRLVYVTTKNGKSINEIMIKDGFGWVDRFHTNQAELVKLQEAAKSKNAGLWKKENPMAPWVFYRTQLNARAKSQ